MSSKHGSLSTLPVPLCEPYIHGNEWAYLKECLDTNWVSSAGAFVDRFERMLAERSGVRHGVATASGTAALHTAVLVAGVQPEEEVVVSTMTFIAPANAVRYVGAWPVFMDADPVYWQMDADKLADFLKNGCKWRDGALYNKVTKRRVKAILPVHILGHPCDMDAMLELSRRYELAVVEDATESLGALYKGLPVGSQGDAACFSFNGNKLITTGGGGMLVTNRDDWAQRARYLTTQARDDAVEYVHGDIGYNYRLTNIQAAMGVAQMEQLDGFIDAKRAIAERYQEGLSEVPGITLMSEAPWAQSAFWMYTVLIDDGAYGMSSRALLSALQRKGIQSRPLWQPMHRSPAHAGSHAWKVEEADVLYANGLSIPCSVGLTAEQQASVIGAVKELCSG